MSVIPSPPIAQNSIPESDTKPAPIPVLNGALSPLGVDLEANTEYCVIVSESFLHAGICRCGQSKAFPLCDGAHAAYNKANGTKIIPLLVTKESHGEAVFVCQCGHAQDFPFWYNTIVE